MRSYFPVMLTALSLVSCQGSSPETPSTDAVILVYVHSEEEAESGKLVELLEAEETRTTGDDGLVEFVVPAGDYIVRAYDINTGGPGRPFVDISLVVDVGETMRVSFFDCTRCVGPGVYLNLSAVVTNGRGGSPIRALAIVGKQGGEKTIYNDDCCVFPPYFGVFDSLGRRVLEQRYCDCLPNTHELGPEGTESLLEWEGTRNVSPRGKVPRGEYTVLAFIRMYYPDRPHYPKHEDLEARSKVIWEGDTLEQ